MPLSRNALSQNASSTQVLKPKSDSIQMFLLSYSPKISYKIEYISYVNIPNTSSILCYHLPLFCNLFFFIFIFSSFNLISRGLYAFFFNTITFIYLFKNFTIWSHFLFLFLFIIFLFNSFYLFFFKPSNIFPFFIKFDFLSKIYFHFLLL